MWRPWALCVEGMGLSDVVYIADKGFYSAANAAMLEARNLRYIIPVRRDNRQIDYSPLGDGEFKAKHGRVVWQGSIISGTISTRNRITWSVSRR
ncbi:MAG: hypothetical protein LBP23_07820, partial [Treponema sp.]|nr:hypothetical protein [Treponema sp.]